MAETPGVSTSGREKAWKPAPSARCALRRLARAMSNAGAYGAACLPARVTSFARLAACPPMPTESQLGLTTYDDDAWLRGFAPRKKRTPNAEPADARLDGMKRAKRSATRGKSHTSAVASESAEEPPAGMGEHSRPAALSATPPARGRAGRRSGIARASPPPAESAGDLAATAADESELAPPAPLPPLPSSGSLHGMTCAQLRELARAHGIPTSGTKVRMRQAAASTAPAAAVSALRCVPLTCHAVAACKRLPAHCSARRGLMPLHVPTLLPPPGGAHSRAPAEGSPSAGGRAVLRQWRRELACYSGRTRAAGSSSVRLMPHTVRLTSIPRRGRGELGTLLSVG